MTIRLIDPDGVVIEAPADGWRTCECDLRSNFSNWCDDCWEHFVQARCFDDPDLPLQEEP